LGFPVTPSVPQGGKTEGIAPSVLPLWGTAGVYHPEELLKYLNDVECDTPTVVHAYPEVGFLQSHLSEQKVILEEFINGKEFSCVVVRLESF
jgi:hypothetical protein